MRRELSLSLIKSPYFARVASFEVDILNFKGCGFEADFSYYLGISGSEEGTNLQHDGAICVGFHR